MSATPRFARDLDLIRDILIWMETGAPTAMRPSPDDGVRFAYHCQLMQEAGWIDATVVSFPADDSSMPVPQRAEVRTLKHAGQEALAAMRADTVWAKTKAALAAHGLPLMLGLTLDIAKGYARQIGIPLP